MRDAVAPAELTMVLLHLGYPWAKIAATLEKRFPGADSDALIIGAFFRLVEMDALARRRAA